MRSIPKIIVTSIVFEEQPDSEVRLAKIVDLILGIDEKNGKSLLTDTINNDMLSQNENKGNEHKANTEEAGANPGAVC